MPSVPIKPGKKILPIRYANLKFHLKDLKIGKETVMTFQYDGTALNGKFFFLPLEIVPDLKQLQLVKSAIGCEQLNIYYY